MFNERFLKQDPEFQDAIKSIQLLLDNSGITDKTTFMQWLRYLPLREWKEIEQARSFLNPFVEKKVEDHWRRFNEKDVSDITDSMLQFYMLKNESFESDSAKKYITLLLIELLVAGTETTAVTICWMVVYLIYSPEYQQELYEEIISTVGCKYPSLAEKHSLHLLQAFIQETLRMASVVPLNLAHKALKESNICGKNIPKDSIVITNLWALHHDERYFNNPNKFDPKRWLDENGHFDSTSPKYFKPFSAGARVCLGETLAKNQLFLIISGLIINFIFKPVEGEDLPSLEGQFGITMRPYDFKVVLEKRETKI